LLIENKISVKIYQYFKLPYELLLQEPQ
jgi:hypothetical protein